MTYKQKVKQIEKIAKQYEIKLHWFTGKDADPAGITTPPDQILIDITQDDLLSVFFHELGHINCFKTGTYVRYHTLPITDEEIIEFIKIAYEAECFVDAWAKTEMAKWFPKETYVCGYLGEPEREQELKKYLQTQFYGE